MAKNKAYFEELIALLKKRKLSKDQVMKLKLKLCKTYKMKKIPTDIEVLLHAKPADLKHLRQLQTKPTRSISGVAPIAVMTKPIACPHGRCIMCSGGPGSAFGDVPQSYTGKEPSTMRAMRAKYDPYVIVFNRLEQFVVTGHVPDKVELIIQGGTFPSFPVAYQKDVVKYCFKALNDFSDMFFKSGKLDIVKFKKFFELPGDIGDDKRTKSIHAKLKKLKGKTTVAREHDRNEKSFIRCSGLTIETRPDWGRLKQGNDMLDLGCTRIELGVQSVYEEVLKKIERGHTVAESVKSIQELLDLGYKLNFHYMLGLPGTTKQQDMQGLWELFTNPGFMPDMLKIYPCLVMKGTKLYDVWKKGNFKPITTSEAAEMIAQFKKIVPRFCRIMRIQRDIPTYQTAAGVDRTNLRQYVNAICKEKGIKCECIRCREVGRQGLKGKPMMRVIAYPSSGGIEYFISIETSKALVGFCRMRFPKDALRKEITAKSALIRELHVFGETAAVGEKSKGKQQHKGYGKLLMKKAESIAKLHSKNKVVVISGVGVRPYYRKLNYKKQGPYMVKNI